MLTLPTAHERTLARMRIEQQRCRAWTVTVRQENRTTAPGEWKNGGCQIKRLFIQKHMDMKGRRLPLPENPSNGNICAFNPVERQFFFFLWNPRNPFQSGPTKPISAGRQQNGWKTAGLATHCVRGQPTVQWLKEARKDRVALIFTAINCFTRNSSCGMLSCGAAAS